MRTQSFSRRLSSADDDVVVHILKAASDALSIRLCTSIQHKTVEALYVIHNIDTMDARKREREKEGMSRAERAEREGMSKAERAEKETAERENKTNIHETREKERYLSFQKEG